MPQRPPEGVTQRRKMAHLTGHGRGDTPKLGTRTPDHCQADSLSVLYY